MYDDVQYVRNALNAGIKGYILKNALETDLIRAVRAVAAGKRFLSPELAAARRTPARAGGGRRRRALRAAQRPRDCRYCA